MAPIVDGSQQETNVMRQLCELDSTSILVDLRNNRCGNCKVALQDELATVCPECGANFASLSSNHVGLAQKLRRRRRTAHLSPVSLIVHGTNYELAELVSC
jgi:hypothetical protein